MRTAIDTPDFLSTAKRDVQIKLNISRNTLIAFLLSLLLHGLLLWQVVPHLNNGSNLPKATTIEVTLAPPPKAPVPTIDSSPPKSIEQEAKPTVIARKHNRNPKPVKSRDFSVPKEMVQQKPSENKAPNPIEPSTSQPEPAPAAKPQNMPIDMSEYVKQKQAQRNSVENEAARINAEAAAAEKGPTEEQKRNQRIAQNLKYGTNGIFDIKRIDALGGSFSFKGWTDNYSNARTQYFDVPAQAGQDTRLLVVKRIIALIREHYQGDFTWESHRLGRSLTLSAKPEDNAGLEDFLMKEFFGNQG
jgi:outer membrane biosynthesis protein TonB